MKRRFNTAGPCRARLALHDPGRPPPPRGARARRAAAATSSSTPRARRARPRPSARSRAELTASGRYAALLFSCEAGEAAGDDYEAAQRGRPRRAPRARRGDLPAELRPPPVPARGRRASCSATRSRPGRAPARGRSCCSSTRSTPSAATSLVCRPAPAPRRLPRAPRALPRLRRPVRPARRARLQGRERRRPRAGSAPSSPFNIKLASLRLGDFDDGRGARALRAAHGRHRAGLHRGGARARVRAHGRAALARERARPRDCRRDGRALAAEAITAAHVDAGEGAAHPRARHPPRLARREAPRAARASASSSPSSRGPCAARQATFDDDASLRPRSRPPRAATTRSASPTPSTGGHRPRARRRVEERVLAAATELRPARRPARHAAHPARVRRLLGRSTARCSRPGCRITRWRRSSC